MSELAQIIALLAVIGLLIVWSPPIARGRKPQPGDEVCPMCKRALLEAHHHGVTVLPRLTGSPEEALTADHLLAVLTEWAEGEEGEGCRWCMFSEGHEEGCPVGEARALIARLEGQPVAEEPRPRHDPKDHDCRGGVRGDLFPLGQPVAEEPRPDQEATP